ncbi:MAG: hypothetical protein ACKVII_04795 [Planctomycetales bacterium]
MLLDELEPAVPVERALGVPALAAGSVRRDVGQKLVVGEFEQVEVASAAERDGQLVVELVKDESEPERRDVAVAPAMVGQQAVADVQACCPGSTKGRPENHSWIEFVRT